VFPLVFNILLSLLGAQELPATPIDGPYRITDLGCESGDWNLDNGDGEAFSGVAEYLDFHELEANFSQSPPSSEGAASSVVRFSSPLYSMFFVPDRSSCKVDADSKFDLGESGGIQIRTEHLRCSEGCPPEDCLEICERFHQFYHLVPEISSETSSGHTAFIERLRESCSESAKSGLIYQGHQGKDIFEQVNEWKIDAETLTLYFSNLHACKDSSQQSSGSKIRLVLKKDESWPDHERSFRKKT